MRRGTLIGFLVLLAVDTFAQVSFKLAANAALPMTADADWVARTLSTPWLYGAVAGYLLAFVTWMSLLKHAPIGPAFAVSHLEVVTVALVAVPLFGEIVGPWQIAGGALVVAGVGCLAMSETDDGHAA